MRADGACSPITSTSPASGYVGIDQSVKYGDTEILRTTAGIIDTGTTLLLLASGAHRNCIVSFNFRVNLHPFADAFSAYQTMTGATMDAKTKFLTISEEQYGSLKSMYFDIGGVSSTTARCG